MLIGLDFALRVCVLEKHEVKRWLDASAEEERVRAAAKTPDEERKDIADVASLASERPRRSSIEEGRERMDHDIALVPLAAGIDPAEVDHAEIKGTTVSAPALAPNDRAAQGEKLSTEPQRPFNALGGIAYLLFRPQPLTGYLVSFLSESMYLWVRAFADQTTAIVSQTV